MKSGSPRGKRRGVQKILGNQRISYGRSARIEGRRKKKKKKKFTGPIRGNSRGKGWEKKRRASSKKASRKNPSKRGGEGKKKPGGKKKKTLPKSETGPTNQVGMGKRSESIPTR